MNKKTKLALVSLALSVTVFLCFFELCSYAFFTFERDIYNFMNRGQEIRRFNSPYYIADKNNPSNYTLAPNFTITFEELLKVKEKTDAYLAVEVINKWMKDYDFSGDSLAVSVNSKGFRGEEEGLADYQQAKNKIFCIGDSVTFSSYGPYNYPDMLEKHLKNDIECEVINAGVEGYSTYHILNNIDSFLEMNPDVIIFMIGWNNLYNNDTEKAFYEKKSSDKIFKKPYSVFLIKNILNRIITRNKSHMYPNVLEGKVWEEIDIDFEVYFFKEYKKIIERIKQTLPETKIVFLSLPCLFNSEIPPSDLELKIGHLPEFTNNAYILAKIVETYNRRIEAYAIKNEYLFIDLNKYVDDNLNPKLEYFYDTLHVHPKGNILIGKHIAEKLLEKKVFNTAG